MAEYILRDQAIIAVTGAKLPDVSASGLPIANGKRSVTDCVRRLKEIPAADVRPVVRGKWTDKRTIEHDGEWYCTACGKEITIYMGADRKDRYAYAPTAALT